MFKGNAKTHFQVLGTGSVGFMMSPFGDDRWDMDDREKLRKIYKCSRENETLRNNKISAANVQGSSNRALSNNQLIKPTICQCVHHVEMPQGYVTKVELAQPSAAPPSEPATHRFVNPQSQQQQLNQVRQQPPQQLSQLQCQQQQKQQPPQSTPQQPPPNQIQQRQPPQQPLPNQIQQRQLQQPPQQQNQSQQRQQEQPSQQSLQHQCQQRQQQLYCEKHQEQHLLQQQQYLQQQINKNQVGKNKMNSPEVCASFIRHRNGLNDEDVKPKSRMKYTQPTTRTASLENANQPSLLCMNCYNANQATNPT